MASISNSLEIVSKWMSDCRAVRFIQRAGLTPRADIVEGIIKLPVFKDNLDAKEVTTIRSWVYHEAGHIMVTRVPAGNLISWQAEKVLGEIKSNPKLHPIFNAVEDVRMERVLAAKFAGCGSAFLQGNQQANIEWSSRNPNPPSPVHEALCCQIIEMASLVPAWKISPMAERLNGLIRAEFQTVRDAADIEGSLEIAKRILAILEREDEKQQQEKKRQDDKQQEEKSGKNESKNSDQQPGEKSESDDDRQDSDGDEENDQDADDQDSGKPDGAQDSKTEDEDRDDQRDDDAEGDGQDDDEDQDETDRDDARDHESNGKPDADDAEENEKQDSTGSDSDGQDAEDKDQDADDAKDRGNGKQDREPDSDQEAGEAKAYRADNNESPAGQDDDQPESIFFNLPPDADFHAGEAETIQQLGSAEGYRADTTRDQHITEFEMLDADRLYRQELETINGSVAVLGHNLEQALRSTARCRKFSWQEHGKLDNRRLVDLAKSVHRRVFCRKEPGRKLNTAVAIVIDQSTSMDEGGKITQARRLAVALGEVLSRLKIPFSITGTHTAMGSYDIDRMPLSGMQRTNPIIFQHYCRFGQPWRTSRTNLLSMTTGYHNIDCDAVQHAAGDLSQRREARKIIISICDGAICGGQGWQADAVLGQRLIDVCRDCRRHGIEVLAFGVGTSRPSDYYGAENFVKLSTGNFGIEFCREFVKVLTGGTLKS